MAWCRPPAMLALCRLSPDCTWRNASRLAPTTCAAARCMSANTGLSSVPRPWSSKPIESGSLPARVTASMSSSSWTVAIWASSANGAGTTVSRSRTPSSRASRMVRSTRIGDMGWEGPKSYAVSEESKTTLAGPGALHGPNVLLGDAGPGRASPAEAMHSAGRPVVRKAGLVLTLVARPAGADRQPRRRSPPPAAAPGPHQPVGDVAEHLLRRRRLRPRDQRLVPDGQRLPGRAAPAGPRHRGQRRRRGRRPGARAQHGEAGRAARAGTPTRAPTSSPASRSSTRATPTGSTRS